MNQQGLRVCVCIAENGGCSWGFVESNLWLDLVVVEQRLKKKIYFVCVQGVDKRLKVHAYWNVDFC